MTVTFRQESGSDSARFDYSSDCPDRLRPEHRERQPFALEWTIWCGLAVAVVMWLALLVLALFTLSTVLPRPPATPLTTPDLAATVRNNGWNDGWEDPPTPERAYPGPLSIPSRRRSRRTQTRDGRPRCLHRSAAGPMRSVSETRDRLRAERGETRLDLLDTATLRELAEGPAIGRDRVGLLARQLLRAAKP
jgi:hypothetical protein